MNQKVDVDKSKSSKFSAAGVQKGGKKKPRRFRKVERKAKSTVVAVTGNTAASEETNTLNDDEKSRRSRAKTVTFSSETIFNASVEKSKTSQPVAAIFRDLGLVEETNPEAKPADYEIDVGEVVSTKTTADDWGSDSGSECGKKSKKAKSKAGVNVKGNTKPKNSKSTVTSATSSTATKPKPPKPKTVTVTNMKSESELRLESSDPLNIDSDSDATPTSDVVKEANLVTDMEHNPLFSDSLHWRQALKKRTLVDGVSERQSAPRAQKPKFLEVEIEPSEVAAGSDSLRVVVEESLGGKNSKKEIPEPSKTDAISPLEDNTEPTV